MGNLFHKEAPPSSPPSPLEEVKQTLAVVKEGTETMKNTMNTFETVAKQLSSLVGGNRSKKERAFGKKRKVHGKKAKSPKRKSSKRKSRRSLKRN